MLAALFGAAVLAAPAGPVADVSRPADAFAVATVRALPRSSFEIVHTTRAFPLVPAVTALALLEHDRLVLLSGDALVLYRWDAAGLVELVREPLPGPMSPVRSPAGLLLLVENESALWVLGNRSPGAVLYGLEGGALMKRLEAHAVPFPDAPQGLRYRSGTNLIEGPLPGLGDGPFVAATLDGLAVSRDGVLQAASSSAGEGPVEPMRVGTALATIGELAVVTSPMPPGEADRLMLVTWRETPPEILVSLPIEGAVRAVAARRRPKGVQVVAAVQHPELGAYLISYELARDP